MNNASVICIIDDDIIYQFTIARILEIQNAAEKIITFSDGEEAFQFISKNMEEQKDLPDIIFLDINMPIMDGWQFLEAFEKIRLQVNKKIAIYLLTSSIDPTDMARANKISSITQYLTKPINPETLRSLISAR